MKKTTLEKIQIVSKVFKILSKICVVASNIGIVASIVSIALLVFIPSPEKAASTIVSGLVDKSSNLGFGTLLAMLLMVFFICIGENIVARKEYKYFSNELNAGTPFTFEGAKELFILGIYRILAPTIATVFAIIAYEIIKACYIGVSELQIEPVNSVGLGVGYMLMSLLCKLGAEKESSN